MISKALFMLALLLVTRQAFAEPAPIVLCQQHCHQRYPLQLSPQDWSRVRALFQPEPDNAGDERRCIGRALVIFEQAVVKSAEEQPDGESLNQLYSEKDLERNAGSFIARLQDLRLIRLHVLRRTEHRNGYSSAYSVSLQQRDNGEIFALDTSATDLGKAPLITPMSEWKQDPGDSIWYRISNIFSSQRNDN